MSFTKLNMYCRTSEISGRKNEPSDFTGLMLHQLYINFAESETNGSWTG